MATLDTFISHSQPPPTALATSQEIRDRGSLFVAAAYRAHTPAAARSAQLHVRNVLHGARPATHEVAAWRCMVLRPGRTGLGGPEDFQVQKGEDDDGERWAGGRVLKVMEEEGVMDAVVVVSRWYGGTMLGPARFAHFETCAREVCRAFKVRDELDECIATLRSLDDLLADLRAELASLVATTDGDSTTSDALVETRIPTDTTTAAEKDKKKKKNDYAELNAVLDVKKARRLVAARENAIRGVKGLIAKKKGT